ncbi:MAG: phosphomannomutase/phosphoglucomutase [Nanobdellota archaeon]
MAFKAYDVRGIYGEDITEELAAQLGNAIMQHFGCSDVVIGRDMRESSEALMKGLCKGVMDAGGTVHSLGLCTTPLVSYAVATHAFGVGVMISASHNPGHYNGFKIVKKPGYQVHTTELLELKKLCEDEYVRAEGGRYFDVGDILDGYCDHVRKTGDLSGVNVVVDYGNGVGALTAKPVFGAMDGTLEELYAEPDGSFPNHEANPLVEENLGALQKRVLERGADCGIAFDGDADRCILVDENGETVPVDLLTAFLAHSELVHSEKKQVYYDLRFSRVVEEEIQRLGGEPVKMRVGNPFYKEALIDRGGALAAEFSGHMMFPANCCIDDGLFAAVKILTALKADGRRLSDIIASYRVHAATPEINMTVSDPDKIFEQVKGQFSDGAFSELDGITIEYPEWWFNLRKSNTEPVVRLRLEADTEELRDEKLATIQRIIENK